MEKYLVEFLPSIIMLMLGVWLKKADDKRSAKADEHRAQMSDWFRNVADCIRANNKGTLALATALKAGDTNGGLTSAMEQIQKSDEKFDDFIQNMGLNHLAKR